jgi:uncharacterized membrane protein
MKKSLLARWRTDFVTGLAVVLPGIVSIAVIVWLFGTVSRFTDTLLFFLPKTWTHADRGAGAILWYWSFTALALAALLIGAMGRLTRYYVGKKIVELLDRALLHIPLLNKIYGTLKQVNEAFGSSNTSFKQVVLVPFPHPGQHAIGFLTGAGYKEVQEKTGHAVLSVFVPTTPNPTSGFLIMFPESEVIKLEMSVADGIKLIISLGAVAPEYLPRTLPTHHPPHPADKPR